MVHADTVGEQLLQFPVFAPPDVFGGHPELRVRGAVEQRSLLLHLRHVRHGSPRLDSLLSRVDEHHHLMAPLKTVNRLLETNFVHLLVALHEIPRGHPDEGLVQRDGPVGAVEEEKARFGVDSQKTGDIFVVREGGGQADDADHALRCFDLPLRARHQGLYHGTSLVIQKVHLVDDEQADQCRRAHVPPLARDDVPLFRRRDNHLGLLELLLRQLHVPR